jgi:hypothetical protein
LAGDLAGLLAAGAGDLAGLLAGAGAALAGDFAGDLASAPIINYKRPETVHACTS